MTRTIDMTSPDKFESGLREVGEFIGEQKAILEGVSADLESGADTDLDDERRFQAACAAMTGLLSSGVRPIDRVGRHKIAWYAVEMADALLCELSPVGEEA